MLEVKIVRCMYTSCCLFQVFDRQGDFLFRIGSIGKHDGALVYPNRVAVCRLTGNVVITERSPTHQVFNPLSPGEVQNIVCLVSSKSHAWHLRVR